ncbi:MAG: Bug family tripartite tricarboxylate transporter substrate binding protein [Pigmentiphaga sp.]
MSVNRLRRLCCIASLAALPFTAAAQSFPDRPISLIVPFPPGGSVDTVARRIAQGMAEALNQSVIVENRAGAGGTIGASYVARAPADGYTLMFATSSATVVSPALYKNVGYDINSFQPLIEVTRGPFILTVQQESPFQSVTDLLAYGKANPGKLNYGSAGAGSAHHLAMEGFKQVSGFDAVHVPYKGGAPAWTALLGGEIQVLFDSAPGPLLYPGRVRPLAVTGPERLDRLPDVPTFAELGIAGVDSVFFFGVVGPAGMPEPVVSKLHAALQTALDSEAVRSALASQGLTASPGTPGEFGELLQKEAPRFRALVQNIGLTLD